MKLSQLRHLLFPLKLLSNMKYNIILNFGYVESTQLGYVPFASSGDFSSPKEAFMDLVSFFKKAYDKQSDQGQSLKKCCLSNKEKGNEFCAKCGNELTDTEFEVEEFMDWMIRIALCDIDTYHGEYVDYDSHAAWEALGLDVENHLNITVLNAEKCFAAALGQSPDDRVDINSIFSDEKDSLFQFYN